MTHEYDLIRAHIEAENAAISARVEAGELSWAFTLNADSVIDSLRRYSPDVVTLDDYLRYELWLAYYEGHKDVYGCKARWTSWTDHTVEGWKSALASLSEAAEHMARDEERARERAAAEYAAEVAAEAAALDASFGDSFIAQHLDIPEDAHLDGRWDDDEPSDGFLSDAEADADVLANCGWGTDEDYGYYGDD
jgi:hypothetical protein